MSAIACLTFTASAFEGALKATAKRTCAVLSALMMFQRVVHAFRYAIREEDFLNVFGAGLTLIAIGTISYALGQDWNVVDAFYFAVSTLTTTSVADPDLVLDVGWMKVFTVFYLLVGVGILVELLRRFGIATVAVRAEERRQADLATAPRESG
jgi:hypothetical protein